ncbi:TfoX/Sxy family protein [Luethyella okanaganae]|uniref:TfoX/Sxy family protein n=1 Tax=Luethyella okanaganae TaxID=69372 RepID=A0ABW1VJQ3_9MICO
MQIPKPTEQDKEVFRSLISESPAVQIKPMFGNLGAFVNGNMFAGLFGSALGVRLVDETTRSELEAIEGTGPFGPDERPMGGYTALPSSWHSTPELASSWIQTALSEVAALPAKQPKTRGKK